MTMPKTSFSSRIKIAFLNMMQAFGAAASQLASNAKLRVQEINLESRRHEILTEFSLQAFEMWHSGVKLPKELSDMFKEISEIDDKLSILRAQKYAKVKVECEVVGEDGEEPVPTECSVEMPAEQAQEEKPAPEAKPAPAAAKPATEAKPAPAAAKPATEAKPAAEPATAEKPKKPRSTVRRTAKGTAKAKAKE